MYDLRLDRKLTQTLFSRWDKETKDWVVNAIASLVVVDQVVEAHEMIALEEAISLLDSRVEIENMLGMVRRKKMHEIERIQISISQAGEIFFYLASIAAIDGKMKKVEADLLRDLGKKLNLSPSFQRSVMQWALDQMKHNLKWSEEQGQLNQQREQLLKNLKG